MLVTGAASAARFNVRTVSDVSAWRGLAEDWNRILRAAHGSPLQSYEFLATWWECMAGDRRLWILLFCDDQGRIAGIAPLQIASNVVLGKRYRTIEFLGMTEDILVPTLLFPEPDRDALRAAFVEHLVARRADWDLIELDEIAVGDPLLEDLRNLSRRLRLLHREQAFHECPYLDLTGQSREAFWAARPRKMLKNLKASERQLNALGAVTVRTFNDVADIDEGYRQFLQVEKLSWKRQAKVGMSSDGRYEAFYARLLAAFARSQGARVMVLAAGDRPLAATIAITFGHTYCSLQIVHDEKYARYSPGTLLERAEMEDLLDAGAIHRYEFLGGALTNKLRWTTTTVATRYVRLRTPEARTRMLDLYEFRAKPVAKRLLRRIGVLKPQPQRPPT